MEAQGVFKKLQETFVLLSNVKKYLAIQQGLQNEKLNFTASMLNNEQSKLRVDKETIKIITGMDPEWKFLRKQADESCDSREIGQESERRGFQHLEVEVLHKKTKAGLISLLLFSRYLTERKTFR